MDHTIEMQGVLTARTAREYQRRAEGGALFRELCAKFEAAQPGATTKREAVAQFVDLIHAFAASILQLPHHYPAHATIFALALLDEITNYTRTEMAARGN